MPTIAIFQPGAVSFGLALLRMRAALSFGLHCTGAVWAAPLSRIVVIVANSSLFISRQIGWNGSAAGIVMNDVLTDKMGHSDRGLKTKLIVAIIALLPSLALAQPLPPTEVGRTWRLLPAPA